MELGLPGLGTTPSTQLMLLPHKWAMLLAVLIISIRPGPVYTKLRLMLQPFSSVRNFSERSIGAQGLHVADEPTFWQSTNVSRCSQKGCLP